MLRAVLIAIFCLFALPAAAAPPAPTEALIDSLTQVDAPAPGIDDRSTYVGFIGDATAPQSAMGLLPLRAATVPPAMLALVRRGVSALPALLNHLDDHRPTRLTFDGNPVFHGRGGFMSGMEYDPRVRLEHASCAQGCDDFSGDAPQPYTVTVGDICFVLIGPIVNRHLAAVRYQPTALVIVNSPTQSPELAAKVRADWQGATAEALEASLLSDLGASGDNTYRAEAALRRLRLYYPQAYAALAGDDAAKRERFEAAEKAAPGR